ncbi:RidA family protein [Phenylobacterium sp.]|jgi:enamine deaminase RidA (YjgF/YER057c/UK114 family)|uniref:RidA family protein n=1 Tax=Phenylobacterium sp. TaxID=1871053 RepID=UPI0037C83012
MSRWTPVIPQARRAAYERSQFAPAVVAGGLIHVSGQVGRDPANGDVPADLETQLTHVFDGLKLVLAEAGAEMSDIISLTSYHVGDMAQHMPAFIATRQRYISDPFPAWTAVGVTALAAPAFLIEVSAIALAPG